MYRPAPKTWRSRMKIWDFDDSTKGNDKVKPTHWSLFLFIIKFLLGGEDPRHHQVYHCSSVSLPSRRGIKISVMVKKKDFMGTTANAAQSCEIYREIYESHCRRREREHNKMPKKVLNYSGACYNDWWKSEENNDLTIVFRCWYASCQFAVASVAYSSLPQGSDRISYHASKSLQMEKQPVDYGAGLIPMPRFEMACLYAFGGRPSYALGSDYNRLMFGHYVIFSLGILRWCSFQEDPRVFGSVRTHAAMNSLPLISGIWHPRPFQSPRRCDEFLHQRRFDAWSFFNGKCSPVARQTWIEINCFVIRWLLRWYLLSQVVKYSTSLYWRGTDGHASCACCWNIDPVPGRTQRPLRPPAGEAIYERFRLLYRRIYINGQKLLYRGQGFRFEQ